MDFLGPRDLLPSFEGTTVDGQPLPYQQWWQRRNIVLFVLAKKPGSAETTYFKNLQTEIGNLKPEDTALVIAKGAIAGLPDNSLAIADRYGELLHVSPLEADPQTWPSSRDILEWLNVIRMRC